ncbi:MAG: hypothetical protein K0R34_29 [Herbinix sp.]|jgi:hypothetical protein|nr:hypothetical protein [Herbinix sp.]
MFKGFRTIFWGIFFVTFHINLGPIAILPVFVGYMIVLSGIDHLQESFDTLIFQKLRITSILLMILGVISFVLLWAPQHSIIMNFYPLLFSVLELILVYNILEGSIEKLITVNDTDVAMNYRSEQRTYTVFMTIYIIGMCIAITIVESTLAFVMIIIGLFLRLWLMIMLGRLKRTFQEPQEGLEDPEEMDEGRGEDDMIEGSTDHDED